VFSTTVNVNSTVTVGQEPLTTFGMPLKKKKTNITCFEIICTFEMHPEVISGMILSFNKYKTILKLEFRLQNINLLKP